MRLTIKENPPGALTLSLALWIGLIPLFSAIHLAMVPHVYWAAHGHLHEVVTVGDAVPVEDANRATASIYSQSSAYSFASLEECPFVDLAIRQGLLNCGWLPPDIYNRTGWQLFPFPSIHFSRPILDRAPKHSPPSRTA